MVRRTARKAVETDGEEIEVEVEVEVTIEEAVTVTGDATVEPVGSGGKVLVWECSLGDFNARSEQEVADHINGTH
jgi:putative transposon-encoded protein